jgi:transcriptional regulator with XRE-family HTH domain
MTTPQLQCETVPKSSNNDRQTRRRDERWPARLVGGRLRETRQGLGLTLDDVARQTGVTKSFVSAVERGETSPSIGSLYQLCEALGLSLAALFEDPPGPESGVVRRSDVLSAPLGEGVENLFLSPRGERRAQVIETHVAPGGSPDPELWSHSGDLVIATVLEGSLQFRFEEGATVLEAGDTITYSPADPHSWVNPSTDQPAVALFFAVPAEF